MAVIAAFREQGSCGEEIAQQVAQEVGYSHFGKEILADAACDTNTTEDKMVPRRSV